MRKHCEVATKFDSQADSSYHPGIIVRQEYIAVTLKTPHAVDSCKPIIKKDIMHLQHIANHNQLKVIKQRNRTTVGTK